MSRRSPITLHDAAWRGKLEKVRSLIAAGESVDQLDYDGFTPLCRAAAGGHPPVVQFLLESGAAPDGLTTKNSHDGDNNLAGSVLDNDEVEGVGAGGETVPCRVPLSESMEAKNRIAATEVVRLLLAAGANVKARGQYLRTPLLAAAWSQWPEMVDTLLDAGADPNFADEDEITPLLATLSGEEDREAVERITRSLLRAGANIHLADFKGQTPLMLAADYGYVELAQYMLEMGADVNAVDCEGRNALARAAEGLANLATIGTAPELDKEELDDLKNVLSELGVDPESNEVRQSLANFQNCRLPACVSIWMMGKTYSREDIRKQINELRATAIPMLNRIVDMLVERGSSIDKAASYLPKAGRDDLLR